MSYAIYLRKSRADAEAEAYGEGETLARHEAALLAIAEHQKLPMGQIYKEVVSGETISSRPVMQKLLNDVEQGLWQGVLVMEVERLARGDTVDQGIVAQAFKLSGTKIITPLKHYDPNNEYDEEYFEFGLFMSRREYKTINRRLQSGRLASVKEGKYVGNKPPYGYDRVKLQNQKGYSLEPNPAEADIVTYIFDLYTNGDKAPDGSIKRCGVSLIVRKLNDLKIPARNGGVWTPGTIQGILKNPVYIGKIRWNARKAVKKSVDGKIIKQRPRAKEDEIMISDGIHQPIVDTDKWQAAQYIISRNRRPASAKRVTNPLAGIVICGKCGHRMVRRPYPDQKYPDTLLCPYTSCGNVSSQLKFVETKIIDALGDWLYDFKILTVSEKYESGQTADMREKSIHLLHQEAIKVSKQMDHLHNLLEQGVYSSEKFTERSKILSEKLNTVNNDLASLKDQLEADVHTEQAKLGIIPKIQFILDAYYIIDNPEIKNTLLRGVIEKVIYTKERGGRWHADPRSFNIVVIPRGF